MKFILTFLLLGVFLTSRGAELPEAYKQVDQMIWLVKDLSKVLNGWKSLGFNSVHDFGYVDELGGRVAIGKLGDANVTWIQPTAGNNAFSQYLQQSGDGVFSLMHRFPNYTELNKEVERLQKLGVKVLSRGSVQSENGTVYYAFFDTKKDGKYYLGIIAGDKVHQQLKTHAPLQGKFTQYAFAIKDPKPVSAFWSKLGLPELEITPSEPHDRKYYGKPAEFTMDLGWQRHGSVVYEWCIPKMGQTVYADHMQKHGEGIQHFGLNVPDIDQAIKDWESKGYKVAMSGGWGDKGKPGSGRFAYMDTGEIGGVMVEFLWSYKN
jgi:hypothetical protein